MGEEEKTKEEEAPEHFEKAVEHFLDDRDTILDYFHGIHSNYLFGKDIRESLRRFRSLKPNVLRLIMDVMNEEELIDKWLHEIGEDRTDEIYEVKKYSDLLPELATVTHEEFGLDYITDIRRVFKYNPDIDSPIIELKIMTGVRENITLKLTPLNIQGMAGALISYVNECLENLGEETGKLELDNIIDLVNNLEDDILPELKNNLEKLRGDKQ